MRGRRNGDLHDTRLREGIEPFYFGAADTQLFGACHLPPSERRRACGVVLCAPMGEEYIRFHRALRQLSDRLVRVGFPVLRFDFYGCGDSGGDGEAGRLQQWRTDIVRAIDELRRRSGAARVGLIGLRLGGSLAAEVSATRDDVVALVLWDAVVKGSDYLDELAALHRDMLRYAHVRAHPQAVQSEILDMLGFPL
jgi:pimeloyl-ACP methyl ester carboxylesterase